MFPMVKNIEEYEGQNEIIRQNKEIEERILKLYPREKIILETIDQYCKERQRTIMNKRRIDILEKKINDLLFPNNYMTEICMKNLNQNNIDFFEDERKLKSCFIRKKIIDSPLDIQKLFHCEITTKRRIEDKSYLESISKDLEKSKSHHDKIFKLTAEEVFGRNVYTGGVEIDPNNSQSPPDLRFKILSWVIYKSDNKDVELKSLKGDGAFMLNDSLIDNEIIYIFSTPEQSILTKGSDLYFLGRTNYKVMCFFKNIILSNINSIAKNNLNFFKSHVRPNISIPSKDIFCFFDGKSGAFHEKIFYEYDPEERI